MNLESPCSGTGRGRGDAFVLELYLPSLPRLCTHREENVCRRPSKRGALKFVGIDRPRFCLANDYGTATMVAVSDTLDVAFSDTGILRSVPSMVEEAAWATIWRLKRRSRTVMGWLRVVFFGTQK